MYECIAYGIMVLFLGFLVYKVYKSKDSNKSGTSGGRDQNNPPIERK